MQLTETTLIDFALGLLDAAERQAVERELISSPALQEELLAIEETLTEGVALSAEPVSPSDHVRTKLLASLQPQTRFAGMLDRVARFFDVGIEQAQSWLDTVSTVPTTPWEAGPIPGISLLHLDGGPRVADAVNCGIVHLTPESSFPFHRHIGDEWSLIIQGSFQEPDGTLAQPGDLLHRAQDSAHEFRAASDEPLVFAVVLYGGFEVVE